METSIEVSSECIQNTFADCIVPTPYLDSLATEFIAKLKDDGNFISSG